MMINDKWWNRKEKKRNFLKTLKLPKPDWNWRESDSQRKEPRFPLRLISVGCADRMQAAKCPLPSWNDGPAIPARHWGGKSKKRRSHTVGGRNIFPSNSWLALALALALLQWDSKEPKRTAIDGRLEELSSYFSSCTSPWSSSPTQSQRLRNTPVLPLKPWRICFSVTWASNNVLKGWP